MVSAGFFGESSKREQKEPSLLRRDGSLLACQKNKVAASARKQRFAARPACLRPSPALRLCLATRFMAFSHFWR